MTSKNKITNVKFLLKLAMFFNIVLLPTLLLTFTFSSNSFALEKPESELNESFTRNTIGEKIDLSLSFRDENGKKIQLKEFFDEKDKGKPVIIIPAYYRCPRLCGLVSDGVIKLLDKLRLELGNDFNMLTISFDHTEESELAKKTADKYRNLVNKRHEPLAWKFLTGKAKEIQRLMTGLGFRYLKDKGEFAHSAAVYVLTPNGKISQFYGNVLFDPTELRYGLIDASNGVLGSAIDHILLYCYRFDPTKGKYTFAVMTLVRIVGLLTLVLLISLVSNLLIRERKSKREKQILKN